MSRYIFALVLFFALVGCGQQAAPTPEPGTSPAPGRDANVDMVLVGDAGTATQAADGSFTVTLTGVSPTVVGFVEDSSKVTDTISTESLATGWSMFFQNGNPTTAMTLLNEEQGKSDSTIVLNMGKPTYIADTDTLTFAATVTAGEIPATFNNASLFIDPTAYQWWELTLKCGTSIVSIIAAAIEEGINPLADMEAANASAECVAYATEIFD